MTVCMMMEHMSLEELAERVWQVDKSQYIYICIYIYSVESWEQDWFVSNVGESGESPKISWYDITAGKSISMSTFDH